MKKGNWLHYHLDAKYVVNLFYYLHILDFVALLDYDIALS